jgi:hypothetical protein
VPPDVEQSSEIAAPAAEVWERAVTPEGINHELAPILRMTMPSGLRDKTIDDVTVGEPLGRSWLLLFGFLPVDYDDLALDELQPGRRFLERSSMLSMRAWQHERIVEPLGEGSCRLTDRLTFEPRIPGTRGIARRIVTVLFRRRHARMAAWAARHPPNVRESTP